MRTLTSGASLNRALLLPLILALLPLPVIAQDDEPFSGPAAVRVTVGVLGTEEVTHIPLRLEPVGREGNSRTLVAQPGMVAATQLPAGTYRLVTDPVTIHGVQVMWDLEVPLRQAVTEVKLSAANAIELKPTIELVAPGQMIGSSDEDSQLPVAAVTSGVHFKVRIEPVLNPSGSPVKVRLTRLDHSATPVEVQTGADGTATLPLPAGRYQLTTPGGLRHDGKLYLWDVEVPVTDQFTDVLLSQELAAVLEGPPEERAATAPPPVPAAPARRKAAPDPAVASGLSLSDEQAIRALLQRWITSIRTGDLETHMACYSPRMERYFLETDVSWEEVKRDKQRFLRRYPTIRKLELSDIRLQRTASGAEATFRKTWDFTGPRTYRGEVIGRIRLRKVNGAWRIQWERERLLWQSRSS